MIIINKATVNGLLRHWALLTNCKPHNAYPKIIRTAKSNLLTCHLSEITIFIQFLGKCPHLIHSKKQQTESDVKIPSTSFYLNCVYLQWMKYLEGNSLRTITTCSYIIFVDVSFLGCQHVDYKTNQSWAMYTFASATAWQ